MRCEVVRRLDAALDSVASVASGSTCFHARVVPGGGGGLWVSRRANAGRSARRWLGSHGPAAGQCRPRGLVGQVPGSYWPFRGFPVAAGLNAGEFAAFLQDRGIRRSLGSVWRFGPVYQSDPAVRLLLRVASRAGWSVVSRRVATNFSMDLGQLHSVGDWPRTSTRERLRYLERQLAGHGAVEWRFVRGSEWSDGVFGQFASSKSGVGLASIQTARRPSSSRPTIVDSGRVWFVTRSWRARLRGPAEVAGAPVAFSLDIDAGSTKHIVANGYDEAWARFSPGKLLAYRNLAEACAGASAWWTGAPVTAATRSPWVRRLPRRSSTCCCAVAPSLGESWRYWPDPCGVAAGTPRYVTWSTVLY